MDQPQADERPLYNSRIIDTYIRLLKERYPLVNIGRLLAYAGMKPYQVADQGHWFTQQQINRFYEKLVQLTGNEQIAREAGRFAATPEAIGAMRQYILSLVGPASAFKVVNQATKNFVRSADYQSRRLGPNKVEIKVTPHPGVQEELFQCENRIGFFEAIVTMFNLNLPGVSHPECTYRGGSCCRYIINWSHNTSTYWRRLRNYGLALLGAGFAITLPFNHQLALGLLAPLAGSFYIAITLITNHMETSELRSSVATLRNSTETLVDQININYSNSQLAGEIGQVISSQRDVNSIITQVVKLLQKRLDFDRGLIMLADKERKRLLFKDGYGYTDRQLEVLQETAFHLDRPDSRGAFVVAYRNKSPLLINDLHEIGENLSRRSLEFAEQLGTQAFICCPIITDDEAIGILAVDNVRSKRPLVQSDMSLLLGIAPVLGISIRNADLLERQAQQFQSTLEVLAASIDARDFLTAGHSEQVSVYAVGICNELGLPQDFREMIRVAALLHDYGKIGVPDFILKKDDTLSADEMAMIRTHPGRTREILEQIKFEGIFRQIPEITGAHHEKLDGSGYPLGLKGDEIPLGARIIAVADFFEAITSKRHYRDPMPLDEALLNLRAEAGCHFEPRIVDALCSWLGKNRICIIDEESQTVANDQRRPRIPCRTQVACQVKQRTISGVTANLSAGGLYVATRDQFSPDSLVDVTFSLPAERPLLIKARGRVAWTNPADQLLAPQLPSGFGIEFIDIDPQASRTLNNFIQRVINDPELPQVSAAAAEEETLH